MIQIFLIDGRTLFDMERDHTDFWMAVGKEWILITTPTGKEVVAANKIVSFRNVNLNE